MRLFIIILVILPLLITGCGKKESAAGKAPQEPAKEETVAKESSQDVQQKVLSFNLEGLTDRGQKKWEVTGESAEAISQDEIKLDNIVAKAYGDDAQAVLTADKGKYDRSKNNVVLRDNVKAVIEHTPEFAAGQFDISSTINAKDNTTQASQVENKLKKTMITCEEEAVFDYEKNIAYFNKNVKVRGDEGDIDADRITVNLDVATKKIKEIVAEGNVRLTKGENTTYSEKAVYNEADKKVTLTGNPKLLISHEGNMSEAIVR